MTSGQVRIASASRPVAVVRPDPGVIGTSHNLPPRPEAFGLKWQLPKQMRLSSVRLHVRANDCRWPDSVPYCPAGRGSSLRLFCHLERIVDLDAEVSHLTFQFRVTE
jgi:hypothetical protein